MNAGTSGSPDARQGGMQLHDPGVGRAQPPGLELRVQHPAVESGLHEQHPRVGERARQGARRHQLRHACCADAPPQGAQIAR